MSSWDYIVENFLTFSFIAEVTATAVSTLQLFFFLKKYQQKRCEWELVYVALMEGLSGAIHLMYSHDFTSFMYVMLKDETPINWLRYVEWLSTCPIIARHLWALCSMNPKTKITKDHLVVILMLVQTMIVTGAWAAFGGVTHGLGTVKLGNLYWLCCTLSWLLWIGLYWRMWVLFQTGLEHEKDPEVKKALFNLQCLFFLTWTFFPVFFMLGPETYYIVDMNTNNALHATGDILAKNYMGHLCWRFHWEIHAHHDSTHAGVEGEHHNTDKLGHDQQQGEYAANNMLYETQNPYNIYQQDYYNKLNLENLDEEILERMQSVKDKLDDVVNRHLNRINNNGIEVNSKKSKFDLPPGFKSLLQPEDNLSSPLSGNRNSPFNQSQVPSNQFIRPLTPLRNSILEGQHIHSITPSLQTRSITPLQIVDSNFKGRSSPLSSPIDGNNFRRSSPMMASLQAGDLNAFRPITPTTPNMRGPPGFKL